MVVTDGVEVVDVREAARLVHRTPETIRRWVWSERVTARKSGTRLLIDRRELLRAAGKDEPAGQATSLREWWEANTSALQSGRAGVSASDLVLADRGQR